MRFTDVQPFRRYLIALGSLLLLGLMITAIVNLMVDPYGVWRLVEIPGINTSKSERRDQNYLFKASDLMRERPQVLIMGSSRAAFGLDPEHPLFAEQGWGKAYNSALTGGHMYAQRRYLEHAIYHNPDLKLIIWGLDFFAFSKQVGIPYAFNDDRLATDHLPLTDITGTLLSLDALLASVQTVVSNLRHPGYQPYYDNGQLTAMDMARQVEHKGMRSRFDQSLKLYLNGTTRLRDYKDSPTAWQEFERVLLLAKTRDIELRLFVSPVHTAMLEAIRLRGRWDDYLAWMKRLAGYAHYWDFAFPSPVTKEPIRDQMQNYWDVSHYRSNVGNRLLSKILRENNGYADDLGKSISLAVIDHHATELTTQLSIWAQQAPDDAVFVADRLTD